MKINTIRPTDGTKAKLPSWWALSVQDVLDELNVNPTTGLSSERAETYRAAFGANTVRDLEPTSARRLLLESLKEPMMVLLLSIAAVSFAFGELVQATVMVFVVAAYIGVEFLNRYQSDRTMTRLRELTQPTTEVIREGREQQIPTADVVVGDILVLSAGVRVVADARLIESSGLLVNEATLTGESEPVRKRVSAGMPEGTNLADITNSVFSGTMILNGEGKAVVLAVGRETEFGKIAERVHEAGKGRTALQQTMTQLSKTLALFAVLVSIVIPVVGFLRGLALEQMVLTWLALTFLMVPGQPPVIITMALASASFELARKNVVVKQLSGVEALGSVTSILTDKTGTITENRMQVERFVLSDGTEREAQSLPQEIRARLLLALPKHINDPTDEAVHRAIDADTDRERGLPVLFEGFSDGHPWRNLTYRMGERYVHAIAGEPELLVDASSLPEERKRSLKQRVAKEGDAGRRVVVFASVDTDTKTLGELQGLDIEALAVLEDPVRPGVEDAVVTLRAAGIETFIVTGDHAATTKTVANKVGVDSGIVTGTQLQSMSDSELMETLRSVRIFARTAPSQKLRLVEALQKQGQRVAVIGDGVNDTPAIKAADVGVAMGEIGTDLAKETADLVLTDDNYAHTRDAVEIGRRAIDNFKKGLTYYFSAKAILLFIFIIPLALGVPFPLSPIHIIMIELLMDLASSTIFVSETAEPDIFKRPPQSIGEYLELRIVLRIFRNSAALTVGILLVYSSLYFGTGDVILSRTAALVTWLLGHILLALNLKQEQTPLLKQGLFSNRFGAFWLLSMTALAALITNVPSVFPFLDTTSLPLEVWLQILVIVVASTFWLEAAKWIRLKRNSVESTPI